MLPNYAQNLHPLEQVTAGRESKDKITWDDDLIVHFKNAQKALTSNKTITLPNNKDTLWIVTDGAVKSQGIGATMYVLRDKLYLAGHFNAKLRKHQITWLPCEVEALAISSAIKHFAPYIVQSNSTTQILTDSRPCVQAYQKLLRGEFSNSSRVSTFLSQVARYHVHIGHLSGAANLPSDFTSRNASQCTEQSCQLCRFISRTEDCVVQSVAIKDVIEGKVRLPFTSRAAWYSTQLECPDLRRATAHIKQGTRPNKKIAGLKVTRRYINVASISSDGLVVIRDELPIHQTG